MNALVKKEIRLLLPAWIAAMLLVVIILPLLQFFSLNNVPYNPDFLPIPFGLGILFLSLASFGQEFSFKSFPLLLSQPIPRNRVWFVKITVLSVAFAFILLMLFVCYKIYFHLRPVYNVPFPTWILLLFGFVIFSGGLWTTLLLRQVTGAFWFSILVPAFLMLVLFEVSEHFHWSQKVQNFVIPATLLTYSLAGFFWARHLFLNAQDTQWTGGEISFPWRGKISERTLISSQTRHWFSALIRKEFQLHQANILIAVLVLGLHLASVVIRKVRPNFENPNVKFILEAVWALWLLMPLLIGCAAVAEERRLGIIESQLCLPVSRRAQLFVKFSVALVLSLILGGVMPLLIERTKDLDFHIFYVVAVIFFISFYASTLARTTLQAIGITIGFSAAICFYEFETIVDFSRFGHANELVGFELLKVFFSCSILFLVLVRLIFGNFKVLQENWKLWRKNFAAVVLSLIFSFALANGIYFRAWEFLTPIEPSHGATRLSDSTHARLFSNGRAIYAILPDGRLWVETLAFAVESNRWRGGFEILAPNRSKSQFIDGSNWIEVAADNYQALGIQSNGSLWNLQKQSFEKRADFSLAQIGLETNWSQIASGWGNEFLLLKNDGSLWIWGTNGYNWRNDFSLSKKLKLDLVTPPARMDNETNWTELFSSGFAYAKKNDGSIWVVTSWNGTNRAFAMSQSTSLDGQLSNFAASGSASSVGIKTNGELWFFWNEWTYNKSIPRKTRLGKNEKWKAAGFANYDSIIAIRSDGTLWKWPWLYRLQNDPDLIKPVQLGNHSDWIALSEFDYQNSIVLAADGSLWDWSEPSKHVWLAPSRKPVFIGNIFQGASSKAE